MKTLSILSGYKICYKEQGSNEYVRYFMTYTYEKAVQIMNSYKRDPPTAREDNHVLKKPKWRVIPITIKEIYDGIWREVPF